MSAPSAPYDFAAIRLGLITGGSGNPYYDDALLGWTRVASDPIEHYEVQFFNDYKPIIGTISVNTGTDVITVSVPHGLAVGDRVNFQNAGGALPYPLVIHTRYFVRSTPAADTLTLSLTDGGAILDLGTVGSGVNSIIPNVWEAVTTTGDAAVAAVTHGAGGSPNTTDPDLPRHDAYRVRAVNADGFSVWVEQEIDLHSAAAVTDPAGVVVTDIQPTSVVLSWTPGFNVAATHYFIKLTRFGQDLVTIQIPWYLGSKLITGLVEGALYTIQIAAHGEADESIFDDTTFTRQYFPDVPISFNTNLSANPLSGPLEIELRKGLPAAGTFTSSAIVAGWEISDGPPGVTLTARAGQDTIGDLGGSPTVDGNFTATIGARIRPGPVDAEQLFQLPVRFLVAGPAFIAWLHADPIVVDLQVDIRTGEVTSQRADLAEAGLRLIHGDTQKVYILFRDGGNLLTDQVPSALALIARIPGQFRSPPILRFRPDPILTDEIATHTIPYIEITPQGGVIDQIFQVLNSTTGPDDAARALAAEAEIVYTRTGPSRTSKPFKLSVVQDYER